MRQRDQRKCRKRLHQLRQIHPLRTRAQNPNVGANVGASDCRQNSIQIHRVFMQHYCAPFFPLSVGAGHKNVGARWRRHRAKRKNPGNPGFSRVRDMIRTRDLLVRSQTLYPAELRVHGIKISFSVCPPQHGHLVRSQTLYPAELRAQITIYIIASSQRKHKGFFMDCRLISLSIFPWPVFGTLC